MMKFYILLNLIICNALLKESLLNEFYYRISVIILLFSVLLFIVTGIGYYKGLFHIILIFQVLKIFLLVIDSLILISWPVQTIKKILAILVILYLPTLILNITHAKFKNKKWE